MVAYSTFESVESRRTKNKKEEKKRRKKRTRKRKVVIQAGFQRPTFGSQTICIGNPYDLEYNS